MYLQSGYDWLSEDIGLGSTCLGGLPVSRGLLSRSPFTSARRSSGLNNGNKGILLFDEERPERGGHVLGFWQAVKTSSP
jgi:hypothetical protein